MEYSRLLVAERVSSGRWGSVVTMFDIKPLKASKIISN